jgi:Macrocin-O-methyltransferase (TylF)
MPPTTDLAARDPEQDYLPGIPVNPGIRKGRNVREGYQRAIGLKFGEVAKRVQADPLFVEALGHARGRSLLSLPKLMNIFLLLKLFVPRIPFGDIIEFGSFRAGCAMFMGHICNAINPKIRVYALDTYEGMPESDRSVDTFKERSFSNVDFAEVQAALSSSGLQNVQLVKGLFEDTAGDVLRRSSGIALAHIDCDNFAPVCYAYDVVLPYLVSGAYLVFDDATEPGCIGATEAVESLPIARDEKHSEQIFPHWVFRHWT